MSAETSQVHIGLAYDAVPENGGSYHRLHVAVDAAAVGAPGLLLAGDAAGFIDPMTGDGLRFAIRGAELAAAAALRELETGGPAHADLAAARRREFAGKWRMNRALRALELRPGGAFWTVTCSVTTVVPLATSVTVRVTVLAPRAVFAA